MAKVIVMTISGFELSGTVLGNGKVNARNDVTLVDENGDTVTVPADRIDFVKVNG